MNKENTKAEILTSDKYEQFIGDITSQTLKLKASQGISEKKIADDKLELQKLREQLLELKQIIATKKSEFKADKEELRDINNQLKLRKNMTNKLNVNFISSNQKTLNLVKCRRKLGL